MVDNLIKLFSKKDKYVWSLYFFKKDRRNKDQPFSAYKKRYRESDQLQKYVEDLLNSVMGYQLSKIVEVEPYTGTKVDIVCDYIKLEDQLINKEWENFALSIKNATDRAFDGKIIGYVISGEPIDSNEKPITLIKFSSPSISMNNKKSIIYKNTPSDELDLMRDNYYRLYWIIDAFVYDDKFYIFNNSFEPVFEIEKAVQKVKDAAIEKIITSNIVENTIEFREFAKSYKSPKTFVSLDEKRIDRLQSKEERIQAANSYELSLTQEGKVIIQTEDDFKKFIKYICLKNVCEEGTRILYRTNSSMLEDI